MAKYDPLLAPFDRAAILLSSNTYQLVPFAEGIIASQLAQGLSKPSFNLDMPGLPSILGGIPGAGGLLHDLASIIKDLSLLNIPALMSDLAQVIPNLATFVGQQLSLGLSVLAIGRNVITGRSNVPGAIRDAYSDYFFDPKGFVTLEGGAISPPEFNTSTVTDLDQLRGQLRAYTTARTAELYVRDLVRITVEATADELFQLRGPGSRYESLMNLSSADPATATKQAWFKGFSALAESTVTSAVEEAAQGVSTFSSSPLIAASLGTFAGIAARKATQNAFLLESGIPLK